MKVTAVALLCLSSCAAHTVREGVKEERRKNDEENETRAAEAKEYLKLSHTYDDFKPVVQDICNENKTFTIDGCTVSYLTEDLQFTDFEHIFDTQCGEYEIVITFNMEDGMPTHANKVSQHSEHWAELIALPEMGKEGCMFAVVSSLDIDPKKVEEDYLKHPRKLLAADQNRRSFRAGKNDFFPVERPEGRELAGCTSYNVIKLGVIYDANFCNQYGGDWHAQNLIHSIVQTMNQWYQAYPLCFHILLTHLSGTCNHAQDPIQGVIQRAQNHCGGDYDMPDSFKDYIGGNRRGSDAVHLLFGGDPANTKDAAGCAFISTLCSDHAVGTNNINPWYSQHDMALLLAHELGHTLSLDDFYPQDQTYIMGDGEAGFKQERMWQMKNFVNQKSQIHGCTLMGA